MTPTRDNDYDAFARAYATKNETSAWNALYERPASLALVGDVAGRRVLDAGCGAGAHAAALLERGARVTGLDASEGLLALAAERLGPQVPLVHADLADPLPLEDDSFDAVLAALVMHYLPDWVPTLRELHRVLAPGGRLVISIHHPFMDHDPTRGQSYFVTYDFADHITVDGQTMPMRFWHRPLRAMTSSLSEAGFDLDVLDEQAPVPEAREADPRAWKLITTGPRFLFVSATARSY